MRQAFENLIGIDDAAVEENRLVDFALTKELDILNVVISGKILFECPTNFSAFMEMETYCPKGYSYITARQNFSESQVHKLEQHVLTKYISGNGTLTFTDKGRMLLNIVNHVCFLYLAQKLF